MADIINIIIIKSVILNPSFNSPYAHVLLQQFQYRLSLLEVLLSALIYHFECLLNRLLSNLTCPHRVLHDLIVKHWEIQCQSQAHRVIWFEHPWLTVLHGLTVCFKCAPFEPGESLFFGCFSLCGLTRISVVISDHLVKKSVLLDPFVITWGPLLFQKSR